MKKLLAIISIVLVGIMMGCASAPQDTELQELEKETVELQQMVFGLVDDYGNETYSGYDYRTVMQRIEELEETVLLLQTRLDNLVGVTGLNGQTSYYENKDNLQFLSNTLIQLKDTIDKTAAPTYIFDEFGEYIDVNGLGDRLHAKYLVNVSEVYYRALSDLLFLWYIDDTLSPEEVVARFAFMVEELRVYDFYTLSHNYLHLEVRTPTYTMKVQIILTRLTSDFIMINLDGILSQDYDIVFDCNVNLNQSLAQQYYDEYVANGTFSGYVLDYK